MTVLSVNLNKLALLRNSRGRDYPDLLEFAQRFIDLGAKGITVHPRPDERHITRLDAHVLAAFVKSISGVEYNVEGYPNAEFIQLIADTLPDQCTLVPDADDQLTSDHGWDCITHQASLRETVAKIKAMGVRVALFLDPDVEQVEHAAATGADRIELYTEAYAESYGSDGHGEVLAQYLATAQKAQSCGLGVNAGHDLDLRNLAAFLTIPNILEVSIGHALTIECIEQGMEKVVEQYLQICACSTKA